MSPITPKPDVAPNVFQTEQSPVGWQKEALDALEPLLTKNPRRFVLFPIKFLAIWRAYKHAVSTFWIADSIDISKDMVEWNGKCSFTDRKVIGTLLLLLETTNSIHEKLFHTISTAITSPEARCFFGFQAMIENVHREALATLTSNLISLHSSGDGSTLQVASMKTLEHKLEWTMKRSEDETTSFSEKLLLFLFVQGLFTASTTAMFKWVSQKDFLRSLVYTFNKITIDRENHINFASLLFYHLERRPSPKYAENMATEMVEIERSFAEELIRSMEADIPTYTILREIECVADGLLASLGYNPVYGLLEDKGEVDKRVTGGLKALYFRQEMSTALAVNALPATSVQNYDELSFDFLV